MKNRKDEALAVRGYGFANDGRSVDECGRKTGVHQ
jgi:hypothetical protein